MLKKVNIGPFKQKLIVYAVLTLVTLCVFWQANYYDFINLDDYGYVAQNSYIRSGLTPDGLGWAFGTKYTNLWNPLVWLSFMLDYQLYGLNPGGYHLTNLILHVFSALLLFWLFCRMTGEVWRSAFVAAFFALHPLHVESVAWIAERKDVLSAFFWMLTLCLYVYYTEKPEAKRYLLVLFSFILALMSKPMVVTLPVIMILLDYWPLNRFESRKDNPILWQLKEKASFFILSAALVAVTLYHPVDTAASAKTIPLISRLANAPVAFIKYITATFWPYDLAIYYPFSDSLPGWQAWGSSLVMIIISLAVIKRAKRLPYLFTGWFWYAITILPVLGIIQISYYAMADRYHYLPSVGIATALAWGIPSFIKNGDARKNILFPFALAVIAVFAVLSWKQCSYWRNTLELLNHTLKVTKGNYLMHLNRGSAYDDMGLYQKAIEDYDEAVRIQPDYAEAYYSRGCAYAAIQQFRRTIEDCSEAIRMKPGYVNAYFNRGSAYAMLGQYKDAIEDFSRVISLQPDYANAYSNRAVAYLRLGNEKLACADVRKACEAGDCKLLDLAQSRGYCRQTDSMPEVEGK